jgi:hypothetical protein
MIAKLTEKLQGWSKEKLAEYTNNAELPLFEDKSTFIQEYDANGLFVYNQNYVKYYDNNGSVLSLSTTFTLQDPEIYTKLYEHSIKTKFNFYQLTEHDIVNVNGNDYMYLKFVNSNKKLGIPFFALDKLDTSDLIIWMEFVEFIIVTLELLAYSFPNDAINLTKLIKDADSNEYALCPNFGPNNWKFSSTRNAFIEEQMRRIIHHKQVISVDTGEEKPVNVDWNLLIKEKTKQYWWKYRK